MAKFFNVCLNVFILNREMNVMGQRAIVLKAVAWNTKSYRQPSGIKMSGDCFVALNGYGHEEWNNNDNWLWRGQKIFHTEGRGRLHDFSESRNLGMIQISWHEGEQYALGVACGIQHNEEADMDLISEELGLRSNHIQLWQLETVKSRFVSHDDFMEHWEKSYKSVKWRCPTNLYYWFEQPIKLNPREISGKEKVTTMHSGYQPIFPETALGIIDAQLPVDHDIRDWLAVNNFDRSFVNSDKGKKSQAILTGKSNKPTDEAYVRYIKQSEVKIFPKHATLQNLFIEYLNQQSCDDVEPDQNYIDVQFSKNKQKFLVEVKPCDQNDAKYAIRMAIGQILEYQHFQEPSGKPMIVLGAEPSQEQINFVEKLGIELCWYKVVSGLLCK